MEIKKNLEIPNSMRSQLVELFLRMEVGDYIDLELDGRTTVCRRNQIAEAAKRSSTTVKTRELKQERVIRVWKTGRTV